MPYTKMVFMARKIGIDVESAIYLKVSSYSVGLAIQ